MIIKERFQNKVAVVTGSADGIGKAVACRLGKEGATLALFDINKELLQATVEEFKDLGIQVKGYGVDVSCESQVSEAILQVEQEWDRIDILVNAAGIVGLTNTKITEFPTSEFDKILSISCAKDFNSTGYSLIKSFSIPA